MVETKKTTKVSKEEKKAVKKPASKAITKEKVVKTEAVKAAKKTAPKTESKVFAVIETGGKQYRVRVGEYFKTEKIGDDMKEGDKVVFDKVLLIDDGSKTEIGTPYISGKKVEGELMTQGKGRKVLVLRYKPKSNYSKKKGHRQPYMQIMITTI